ncbi:MAG TPA: APC family permease [Thermoplasmata archaeon]|nr:APC family permease [Thermoplasmata archaeon]
MAAAADRKLRRVLTRWDLLGLSMGGIIGSGWLFGVNKAAYTTGPSSIFSWIIGGILVLFVALVWAEIAGMIPRSGAIARYPFYTHGSYTGFTFGWAYFLTAVTVPAIEVEGALLALGSINSQFASALVTSGNTPPGFVPLVGPTVTELTGLGTFFAAVLLILFFFLNYFGIRLLGKTNTYVTVWKIVIPVLTFIILFTLLKSSNFNLSYPGQAGFFPFGVSNMFYAIPASGVFFAYLGFRQGLEYGGEAKNPQRDIPLVTIGSVLLAMVIYTLLQVAYLGSINWSSAGIPTGDWAALSTSVWAALPLKYAVAAGVGAGYATFAAILLLDGFISPSGTGWIYLGTSTRTLYGLSVEGYFPRGLHSIHERFRIPWVALIVSVVIGLIFLAPLPSWYALVGFISSASALTYVTGGAMLPALRKYAPNLHRPFRLPMMWFFAGAGFIASAMVLFWSGFGIMTWVYIAVFVGLGLYMIYAAPRRMGVSPAIAYVLGILTFVVLGVMTWFGPLWSNNGVNTFLWSTTSAGAEIAYFALYGVLTIGVTVALWALTKRESRQHISAGIWIPIWLFVFYILSYVSEFGPGTSYPGANVLIFPYGTIIAVVVSAIFFVWAALSAFHTDEIKAIAQEGGVVHSEDDVNPLAGPASAAAPPDAG